MRNKSNEFRCGKDLKILSGFIYKGVTGLTFLHVEVYDKKTKKMFIDNLQMSSYSLRDVLEI